MNTEPSRPKRETLAEAGYTYVRYDRGNHRHILRNEDGKLEAWVANKGHASYGLIHGNTHLEFLTSDVPTIRERNR